MIRKCVECGRDFKCSPTDKTVTCGKACSSKRRSRLLQGHGVSEEAKSKIRRARFFGDNPGLELGTAAARASPKGGRFETNSAAKDWILISPDGEEIRCTNLLLWIRENADLFEIDPNNDIAVNRVAAGFRTIKCNAKKNMTSSTTYKGWCIMLTDDDRNNYEKRRNK